MQTDAASEGPRLPALLFYDVSGRGPLVAPAFCQAQITDHKSDVVRAGAFRQFVLVDAGGIRYEMTSESSSVAPVDRYRQVGFGLVSALLAAFGDLVTANPYRRLAVARTSRDPEALVDTKARLLPRLEQSVRHVSLASLRARVGRAQSIEELARALTRD